MFAEDEAVLLLKTGLRGRWLDSLVSRRVAGEPLETVLGWVAFAGRRLVVRPGVFVPRRRTHLLARAAAAHAHPGAVLLELCCGVGPVAAIVADDGEAAEVHLADVDEVALRCARVNVPRGRVHLSDLYADLPADLQGRVDVLAANAPYVPREQLALMPAEARDHEPTIALDGGKDGVEVHRRIVAGAGEWLSPSGVLLIETSAAQAPLTCAELFDAGFSTVVVTDREVDGCVVLGTRPLM